MGNKRVWVVLALLGLVLLSGCAGSTDTERESTTPSPPSTTTEFTTTSSATTAEKPDSPFEKEQIRVAVDAGSYNNQTRYEEAGKSAVRYWQNHTDEATYPVGLLYTSDPSEADVVIQYQPTIDVCGGDVTLGDTYLYCGPVLYPSESVSNTQYIDVAGRYQQQATVELTKEGLGNLLGLENPEELRGIDKIENPPLRNPFLHDGPIVVSVNNTVNDRNFAPLVREAVHYWNGAPSSHKNYTVDFVVEPNATSPDVEVRFVEVVERCGYGPEISDTLGCAAVLNRHHRANPPEIIEIATGYTNETSLAVLKHEFGHLHGREHGQEPMPLMNATVGNTTHLPQPDAVDRPNPWKKNTLLIYADNESLHWDEREAEQQVQAAVQYYRDHPAYRAENLTLEFTSNRSRADITINGSIENCENLHEGSCNVIYGRDTDSDPTLEYYTTQHIFVSIDQEENIGWHVGTWLGYSLTGANETAELPPPFDEPRYDERSYFWR